MQLVSIELSGFKSFPKATKIAYADGVTAIVGPNGCGKTNIVDAVRWALGEQKTSVLRSDRMENVIFNGTATRKPIGMAEVSIAINNSDGALPTPYTEVEIKRRLFRDGGSEYFLNGTPARLKDIVDLIQDTGLGPDSYSILELRMVEEILRESGDGRRHLFEEVAGVAKYKSRRQQAQNKLQQTEEDLERLADILTEVERRVSSLKRQVTRARRYQKLRAELSLGELALIWRDYVRLRDELAPLQDEMKRTGDSSLATRSLLRAQEAHLEELRVTALNAEKELGRARGDLEGCITEVASLETENATLDARTAAARDTISRSERTRILLEEKRELLAKRKEFQQSENGKLTEALQTAEKELETAQGEHREREKALEEIVYRARHHDKYMSGLRAEVAAEGRRLSEQEAGLASLTGRQEAYQHELDYVRGQSKALEAQLDGIARKEAEIRAPLQGLEQEATELRQKLESHDEAIRRSEENLRALRHALDVTESRVELLSTLSEQGPRSDPALKFLREKPVAGLIDLLSDSLDVPEPYTRAFAAILGPAAYYYLVESADAAFSAIEALRKAGAGQAVFVPVNELETSEIPQTALPEGTLGRAADFLDGRLDDPIVRHFLGNVVLVQDWETACTLRGWGRENGLILVSLNGEWITPQGVVRGGGEARAPTDFGLEKQLERLRAKLQEARSHLEAETRQHGDLVAERMSVEERLSQAEEQIGTLQNELGRLHEGRLQQRTLLEHLQERERNAEKELAALTQSIDVARAAVAKYAAELAAAQGKLDQAAASGTDLEKELSQVRRAATTSRDKYHKAERHRDEAKHRLELSEAELDRIITSSEEITTEVRASDERAAQARQEEETFGQRKREVEGLLLQKFHRRDEFAKEVDRLQTQLDEARDRVRQQEEKLRTLRSEREESLDGERKLEREIARLQAELDALVAGAKSNYGMDLSTEDFADAHAEIVSAQTSDEAVAELKTKIDQLGPVNLLAIEEFEQENERLQAMLANRDDLLKAKATLEETIAKINETAQSKFLETFGKVRANFQRLFREFFGAGEADLILSGTDLLEADVTLWANPSGKRLKSLSLMSGGEKAMTAIALLFALYQVKPSPFCILDEVDAPLDDANIARFNEMIRRHATETQFILVTHNKRTMEAADALWGVTMEEEGISKVVSVRLTS